MPSDCRPRILANPGFVQYFSPVDQFPLSEKVYDAARFRLLPAKTSVRIGVDQSLDDRQWNHWLGGQPVPLMNGGP